MSVIALRKVERTIPRDSKIIFLVRDIYLAKSFNGEHNVSLKPMDICRFFGKCGRADVTNYGLVLRWLALQGYLVEVRKRKYVPTNKFLEWVMVCKWPKCNGESLCGLIGECPYHRLQQIIEKRRRGRQ